MFATIQRLIEQETRVAVADGKLAADADLYSLGMTSFDAIRLLVAVEREFQVEFPRDALNRKSMASIEAIAVSVLALWQLEMEPPRALRQAA
ncbi:phosphopantetheine-binding protein [Methylocystis parvus]|uniref:Acyl carrier protein n=1 Tax=Methylocystis parvus TaxID=134 RepID=A0A6B8M8C7_9HYPH|nr:phosphopantetheine-binding protein [Methylocystis parvus]QGM99021.1 acyl carrier protein [Methylocystis parvus]WBK00614.1 phosphopantetheine-binding protein [Methylocystis parvus OBBP]